MEQNFLIVASICAIGLSLLSTSSKGVITRQELMKEMPSRFTDALTNRFFSASLEFVSKRRTSINVLELSSSCVKK